jgi:hypothetical protein
LVGQADEIARRNEAKKVDPVVQGDGKESLRARQERLKRQRDMLLAKKKADREAELKEYAQTGGIGANANTSDEPK